MKLEFSQQIFERKNAQIVNSIKIRPVGTKLFHVDRQTDRETDRQTDRQTDEANSLFSQFSERAKEINLNKVSKIKFCVPG